MTQRRELKRYAKQAMSGKYGTLILAFVVVQALALSSSMLSSALFPGEETLDLVLGYAFTFILTLLINVISAGLNYMYLNIARGKAYSLNDLIYFYKHHPDRVIIATFFLAVLNLLTMLPYTIYGNMNTPAEGASLETQITWMYTSIFLMLVGMIVYQILSIPLEMTYYILMTETMFYRDLTGELTAQKQEEERNAQEFVNPMFGGTFGENQQNQQQFWSVTGDSSVASDENKEVQNNAASENTQDSLYGSVENNRTTQDNPYDSSESKEVQDSLQSQTTPEEEEDNEPKPWDEYFNSLK